MVTKRILIYLAFAFGIPWVAALVTWLPGMTTSNLAQAAGTANLVFIATPWLANLAARLVTGEGWGSLWLRPNFKRGWRFYLAAWLLPLAAAVVGGAAFYLLFPQSFDPNLGVLQKMVEGTPSAAVPSPWLILVSVTLSMMLISVPINTVVSMGEELGWRAYLLPKLVERFTAASDDSASYAAGARNAALLTGLVHGVWHWPLLLMTASLAPGSTWLTPVVYLVFTCALSMLLSWVTLRSGSAWTAAIGHGAANPTAALPGFMLLGQPIPLMGPEPTGLVGGIGYLVLALVLFFSRGAFAPAKEDAAAQAAPVPVELSQVEP